LKTTPSNAHLVLDLSEENSAHIASVHNKIFKQLGLLVAISLAASYFLF
jgi:hypothetical protein